MRTAKSNARGKSRRQHKPQSTKSTRSFRVTATWAERTGKPLVYETQDRARARGVARGHADLGAFVVVDEHVSFGTYRRLYEIDGPAIVAEREAKQRAAELAEDARIRAELHRRAEARRAAVTAQRDRAQAAALMVQPPVPRNPAQRGARHTAGGR